MTKNRDWKEIYLNKIVQGDCLELLKQLHSESVNCVITSPPYWALRDYGVDGQLGLEATPEEYIKNLVNVFSEVKRVLRKDGTLWVVIGDTYSGNKEGKTDNKVSDYLKKTSVNIHKKKGSIKEKSLVGIPFRFALAMIEGGWILRNTLIWHKPNAMPSSVNDRFTVDFEYVFFFAKSKKYYFEQQFEPHLTQENRPDGCVREREYRYDSKYNKIHYKNYSLRQKRGGDKNPDYKHSGGRNKRSVWSIPTKPFKDAHFAVYPEKLIETPIIAGCPPNGIVLDPFMGSGTTAVVARKLGRNFIGFELNPEYIKIAEKRLKPYLEQKKL